MDENLLEVKINEPVKKESSTSDTEDQEFEDLEFNDFGDADDKVTPRDVEGAI